jgi:hypothetical protein
MTPALSLLYGLLAFATFSLGYSVVRPQTTRPEQNTSAAGYCVTHRLPDLFKLTSRRHRQPLVRLLGADGSNCERVVSSSAAMHCTVHTVHVRVRLTVDCPGYDRLVRHNGKFVSHRLHEQLEWVTGLQPGTLHSAQ